VIEEPQQIAGPCLAGASLEEFRRRLYGADLFSDSGSEPLVQ
jgi:hypothetical protein